MWIKGKWGREKVLAYRAQDLRRLKACERKYIEDHLVLRGERACRRDNAALLACRVREEEELTAFFVGRRGRKMNNAVSYPSAWSLLAGS